MILPGRQIVLSQSSARFLDRMAQNNPNWYTCGNRNDPSNTQCATGQNSCRAYRASNPFNYCCPGNRVQLCPQFGRYRG